MEYVVVALVIAVIGLILWGMDQRAALQVNLVYIKTIRILSDLTINTLKDAYDIACERAKKLEVQLNNMDNEMWPDEIEVDRMKEEVSSDTN